MNKCDVPDKPEGKSLIYPEFAVTENGKAVLPKVMQEIAALQSDTGRSPWLFDAKRRVQTLSKSDFVQTVEDSCVTVCVSGRTDLISKSEQFACGLRIRHHVVLDGRRQGESYPFIEVSRGG